MNNIIGRVNFIGILACYPSITEIGDLSCKCLKLSVDTWIIYIEETEHMTFNKKLLTNIKYLPYPLITLPNAYRVKATEIGDA